MKNIDKYQKMILGFLIGVVSIALIYFFVVFNGSGSGGSGSDSTGFPFYIFFPSWMVIFIPIIAHQRQEAKRKEEELRNRYEEWKEMHLKKKKEILFIIGIVSLIISILLDLLSGDFLLINFLQGLFTGISLVTNLGYLFKLRIDKNQI